MKKNISNKTSFEELKKLQKDLKELRDALKKIPVILDEKIKELEPKN